MKTVAVIGGGASGIMAAISAAENGAKVVLLEKNEKIGKKIYLTGKGRCNVTNNKPIDDFFKHIYGNKQFLFSAFKSFDNKDLIRMLEDLKIPLVVERGDRVFPKSGKSSDIIKAFNNRLGQLNVEIRLNNKVKDIRPTKDQFMISTDKGEVFASEIIVATGGVSYPMTGSDGDGIKWAKNLGIKSSNLRAGLSGMELINPNSELSGLTLKNVKLSMYINDKKTFDEIGELLFTRNGISGPLVLSASNVLENDRDKIDLYIDLKPGMTEKDLDDRLLKEFCIYPNKEIFSIIKTTMPKALVKPFLDNVSIHERIKCNQVTKEMRKKLIIQYKNFSLKFKMLRPIDEAIITAGGISTKEINPKTMESNIYPGMFFAGEIIDLHGDTGGYNLQIAFSTGYVAGLSAAKRE
ncbi:MAG: NAD(P)/FAD-dependent oxidoreductase [Tissierellia bacterium]|nr:NAD(P)/FAD-dependent oxidoreductase [Tissierellia bacterium]